MFTLHRRVLPAINAFFVTACLLYFMFELITTDEPVLKAKTHVLNFERLWMPEDVDENLRINKPPAPEEAEEKPDVPDSAEVVDIDPIQSERLVTYYPRSGGGKELDVWDGNLVLVMGFPPSYPSGPLTRGKEGYVVVGFSVSASGAVFDSFVIESEPKGVFDRSALKAISKFKYKPRMVGGKPVSTDGQHYKFTYKIEE